MNEEQAMVAREMRDKEVRDLANTIAIQAQAIADGTVRGPVHAAVARLYGNVDTLKEIVPDDREDMREIAAHVARRSGR